MSTHPTTKTFTDREIAEAKFAVAPNGSDSRVCFITDNYEEARLAAKELSIGHWLGFKFTGPSGKLGTFFNGIETGYLDSTKGWVAA